MWLHVLFTHNRKVCVGEVADELDPYVVLAVIEHVAEHRGTERGVSTVDIDELVRARCDHHPLFDDAVDEHSQRMQLFALLMASVPSGCELTWLEYYTDDGRLVVAYCHVPPSADSGERSLFLPLPNPGFRPRTDF